MEILTNLLLDYISSYILHICKIYKRGYVINQMFKFKVFIV